MPFTEEIIRFCATGDPEPLARYAPPELSDELRAHPARPGMRAVLAALTAQGIGLEDLLQLSPEELATRLAALEEPDPLAVEETRLLFRVRWEVTRKYRLDHGDVIERLRAFREVRRERVDLLERALAEADHETALAHLLEILEALRAIILRPGEMRAVEDIYRKRHIAAGIPSMYGTYREERFEAMGLSFRLEALAAAVADRAIADAMLRPLDHERLTRIAAWLALLLRAVRIDGFRARGLMHCATMLEEALASPGTALVQYRNIFWLVSRNLETLVQARILSVYEEPARRVIARMLDRGALPTPAGASRSEAVLAISEGLFRDVIAESFGLQRLDALVGRVLRALEDELAQGSDRPLGGAPERGPAPEIVRIDEAGGRGGGIVALGNKGFMLRRMRRLGFPVPEGFVLATGLVRERLADADTEAMEPALTERIAAEVRHLEELHGTRLGDPERTLLLSVRGGAPISMPGMLETFLNVGMNNEIAEGLAARPGRAWGAWDAYRRLLQFWGMSHGLGRDLFDELMRDAKRRYGAAKKAQLPAGWMRELALRYRALLIERGVALVEDPMAQLLACIALVGRSWDSEAARVYRHEVGIADEWGTAVIVQTMVFGNLGPRSGSGVVLTRHPVHETKEIQLYGDFVVQAQGDDVVAGVVETFPIGEAQRRAEAPGSTLSLERDFPAIFAGLTGVARTLVQEQGLNHQEIEFTFEGDRAQDLFILQTRDAVTSTPGIVHGLSTDGCPATRRGSRRGSGSGVARSAGESPTLVRRSRRSGDGTPVSRSSSCAATRCPTTSRWWCRSTACSPPSAARRATQRSRRSGSARPASSLAAPSASGDGAAPRNSVATSCGEATGFRFAASTGPSTSARIRRPSVARARSGAAVTNHRRRAVDERSRSSRVRSGSTVLGASAS